jgi:chitin synthase
VVKYIYIAFVVLQFILALGNRPKGSKWLYITSFIVFALIQYVSPSDRIDNRLYTLVSSFFLVGLAFSKGSFPDANGVLDYIGQFIVSTNGVITIALISVFGVYVLASLLYLDPWHLITSFGQYLVMATSYINIINVYAFCNWHDVSWGTKGADKADSLPSAQTTKKSDTEGGASIEVLEYELPQADIDSKFEKVVKRALAKYQAPKKNAKPSLDDAYKNFRTKLIITWIFSNWILVLLITSDSLSGQFFFDSDAQEEATSGLTDVQKRTEIYFRVILYATAILAIVRYGISYIKTLTLVDFLVA